MKRSTALVLAALAVVACTLVLTVQARRTRHTHHAAAVADSEAMQIAQVAGANNEAYHATLVDDFVPLQYGTSANGFSSAARGWNSFGLQAASAALQSHAGWAFNDYHFRQQCGQMMVPDGQQGQVDYYCSIDSGWSQGCNGDAFGVPTPDTNILPNVTDLAAFLHARGLKLGLYVLPGAFSGDADKTIAGTSIRLGDVFNNTEVSANCRSVFNYSADGVAEWHDSVVSTFVSWGVDLIKLDYVTPGSPEAGENLWHDTSGSVLAYHQAIERRRAKGLQGLRLDISWKLDRSGPYWEKWRSAADSLRVDQDINNSGKDVFVDWHTVLRTLDYYRQFINERTAEAAVQRRSLSQQQQQQQVHAPRPLPLQNDAQAIHIRPDMDNLYVGNAWWISGLSDVQRYTMAMHWVGAGANLITGSDLTHLDALGTMLLTDPAVYGLGGVADLCAQSPMQPRNPSGWGIAGGNAAMQLQAWVAGPSAASGQAVVILANYGPDPCYHGAGCPATYDLNWGGVHNVSITLADLGLQSYASTWSVQRVWGGGGHGGPDHTSGWTVTGQIESWLGPAESVLYVLTPA